MEQENINGNGNFVLRAEAADHALGVPRQPARYGYDLMLIKRGYRQYDTHQDAWYFGVWVHLTDWIVFTYAEGDRTLVQCLNRDAMRAELADMAQCYGDPPPAFISLDPEDNTRTLYFDARPSVD